MNKLMAMAVSAIYGMQAFAQQDQQQIGDVMAPLPWYATILELIKLEWQKCVVAAIVIVLVIVLFSVKKRKKAKAAAGAPKE